MMYLGVFEGFVHVLSVTLQLQNKHDVVYHQWGKFVKTK
jgi:hypothetical protein